MMNRENKKTIIMALIVNICMFLLACSYFKWYIVVFLSFCFLVVTLISIKFSFINEEYIEANERVIRMEEKK